MNKSPTKTPHYSDNVSVLPQSDDDNTAENDIDIESDEIRYNREDRYDKFLRRDSFHLDDLSRILEMALLVRRDSKSGLADRFPGLESPTPSSCPGSPSPEPSFNYIRRLSAASASMKSSCSYNESRRGSIFLPEISETPEDDKGYQMFLKKKVELDSKV